MCSWCQATSSQLLRVQLVLSQCMDGPLHLNCRMGSFISFYPVRLRSGHCTHSTWISPRTVFTFVLNFSMHTLSTTAIHAQLLEVVWTNSVPSYCHALVTAMPCHKYPFFSSQWILLASPSGITSSRKHSPSSTDQVGSSSSMLSNTQVHLLTLFIIPCKLMNGRNCVLFITASPASSTVFAHHKH